MNAVRVVAYVDLLGSWAAITSAQAVSAGNCSPAIHGNQNQITVNCSDPTQLREMYRILKMIADNQLPLKRSCANLSQLRVEVSKLRNEAGKSGTTATQSGHDNAQTVVGSNATIQQYSTGDCSPNNVGSGNVTNCAQRSAP